MRRKATEVLIMVALRERDFIETRLWGSFLPNIAAGTLLSKVLLMPHGL